MKWFEQLSTNPHVEAVLVTDNEGRILLTTRYMSSKNELIASMIQAADVLAQTLTSELERGPVQMLHISTDREHLLIFPLANSTYHLVLIVQADAPLVSIIEQVERMLPEIDASEFAADEPPGPPAPPPRVPEDEELNAQDLIEAVREWLQNRPRP